jgi:hypothetical protein
MRQREFGKDYLSYAARQWEFGEVAAMVTPRRVNVRRHQLAVVRRRWAVSRCGARGVADMPGQVDRGFG